MPTTRQAWRAYPWLVERKVSEPDADPQVLSVGASVGGVTPRPSRWGDAVMALARRVREMRGGTESAISVNVVYYVPGEVVGVDWDGVRTGRYDAKAKLLMVQVAVPDEPQLHAETLLLERLGEAITEAERWASRKGVASDLASLHAIVDRLKAP